MKKELREIDFRSKNPKQILAAQYWIDDETEEILYGGAKYGGKTYLGCSLIFGNALIYPETHYFIARKALIDLTSYTIPSVHEVFKHWELDIREYAPYNAQSHCFNLHNGSKVFLIQCNDVPGDPLFERFGSMQMTRGWIEEGGEVAEAAKANLFLAVGRWKNDQYGLKKKLLITANPKKGWMKREFIDPPKLPKTRKYIQSLPTDNVHGSKDYILSLKNQKDKVRRQRLWEGKWDYDEDDDALITFDALSDAFSNTIKKDGNKYLVVDVARKGVDTTVFSLWEGLELYAIKQFEQIGTDKTIQNIKDVAAAEKIPYSHILIDEDGIGGGVVDQLKGVKGFTANSTPVLTASQIRERQNRLDHGFATKTTFSNLRAQCGWKLAELINDHAIAFSVDEWREKIVEELTAMLRNKDITSESRKMLRAKADVKEEIGRSPDIGDTLLMRAFFEILKDANEIQDATMNRVVEEQRIIMTQNKFRRAANDNR